jgi:hypothetical protein
MNPQDRPRRRMRSGAAMAVLALTLVVGTAAACSGDDDEKADTESVNSSNPLTESNSSGSGDDNNDDSDSNGEPSNGGSGGQVLGTSRANLPADTTDSGTPSIPLRIDVTRLERHGDLVELTVELTNEAEADDSGATTFAPWSMFGDGPAAVSRYDTSEVGVVDGASQKLYMAIIDSEDVCVCTEGTASVTVQPGDSWTIQATIGGVPDDVDQLDVHVPGFPNVVGIPLR